jgi:hypothetical protein
MTLAQWQVYERELRRHQQQNRPTPRPCALRAAPPPRQRVWTQAEIDRYLDAGRTRPAPQPQPVPVAVAAPIQPEVGPNPNSCEVCGAPAVASVQSEGITHAYCRDHLAGGYDAEMPPPGAGRPTARVLPRPAPVAARPANDGLGGWGGANGIGLPSSDYGGMLPVNPNQHWVSPHMRNGRPVAGHWQTNPNRTRRDNFGAPGRRRR